MRFNTKISLFNIFKTLAALSDLHLGDFSGFQRNLVNGLALALVGHRGINLGGGDVLMAKDVLDGIDAGACLHLQGSQCMAAAMVGYMLGDARLLQPVLQRGLGQTVVEADENFVSRLAALVAVVEAY